MFENPVPRSFPKECGSTLRSDALAKARYLGNKQSPSRVLSESGGAYLPAVRSLARTTGMLVTGAVRDPGYNSYDDTAHRTVEAGCHYRCRRVIGLLAAEQCRIDEGLLGYRVSDGKWKVK